jgi:hypothetical protein
LRRAEFPDTRNTQQAALVTAAGRIESLLQQSKYDEAFPQFKLLLDQYPSTPFPHYAYGTALIAISEFEQAAAHSPSAETVVESRESAKNAGCGKDLLCSSS